MEAKWTPGPWTTKMSPDGCEECKGYVILRDDEDDTIIARVPYFGPWCPHNARLIAAAPTMAQKLADTVAWLDREIHEWEGASYDEQVVIIERLEELRDDLAETLRQIKGE